MKAWIILGLSTEQQRNSTVDDCIKIQMDPPLLQRDCEGCAEVPICSMKANLGMERYSILSPRVEKIGMLHSWTKSIQLNLNQVTMEEIQDIGMFSNILSQVQLDFQEKEAERRK